jgi:hypothetical protein
MDVKAVQSGLFSPNAGRAPQMTQALRARGDKQIALINVGDTTARAIQDLGAAARQSASASMVAKVAVSPGQASAAYLAQAKG